MSLPELRFNEFSDGWKSKPISEALTIGSGRDYKHLEFGNIPVFGTGGLMTTVNKFLHDGETVCIGRKGTIDKPMYFNGKLWTVDTLFYTHSFKEVLPKFIFNLFQRINWKEHNEASGVPSLSKSTIEKIVLNVPSVPEQTKIANFLTAVDEKITQLTQKHDLLTQYKKGVIQQIFSQELRFKDDDGQDFPEWEESALGEIGEIVTGKTPSTTDASLWDGDVQFVTPTDINEGKYQFKTTRTVVKHSKLKVLPEGSIMFTCIASIGKMSLSTKPCITNQQINSLIPTSIYNNEYIYYGLLSITDYIKSTQSSSTLPIINKTEFSKFVLPIPCEAEQTKIANFLTAIDDKITTTQSQLKAVKQYKHGLLQQMFV